MAVLRFEFCQSLVRHCYWIAYSTQNRILDLTWWELWELPSRSCMSCSVWQADHDDSSINRFRKSLEIYDQQLKSIPSARGGTPASTNPLSLAALHACILMADWMRNFFSISSKFSGSSSCNLFVASLCFDATFEAARCTLHFDLNMPPDIGWRSSGQSLPSMDLWLHNFFRFMLEVSITLVLVLMIKFGRDKKSPQLTYRIVPMGYIS